MGKYDGYLLVSDMDGTIINSNGIISEENKEAIKYFINNGGEFTLATGRTLASAYRYIKDLPCELPVILYNGSKIYDYNKKKIVYETFLEDEIKKILKLVKERYTHLGIEIYVNENVYIYNSCAFTERFSKKGYEVFYNIPEEIWNAKWTKILILGQEAEIDILEKEFVSSFGKVNLVRSGENFLEIIPENVSKGNALELLCKINGFNLEKTIALGDNMNDLELITKVAYGFGVRDGNEKLIDVAKYKTSAKDEHPLQKVIEELEKII
jgi:HAD-superfamily hydrolase, subfamily IIB